MHEEALDALDAAPSMQRLPPVRVGHLEHLPAEARDRVELRRGGVLGHRDRRRHAELAGDPGDALRHVAGARGDQAARNERRVGAAHAVGGAADLERVDRLQRLELAPDLGGGPSTWSRTSGVRTAAPAIRPRAASISSIAITARPRRRRPRARARATASSAAARSSTASPSERNTVSAAGAAAPAVARRSPPRRAPRGRAPDRRSRPRERQRGTRRPRWRPTRGCRRRARQAATVATSSSRVEATLAPIALTWAPGASQARSITGVARAGRGARRRRRPRVPRARCRRPRSVGPPCSRRSGRHEARGRARRWASRRAPRSNGRTSSSELAGAPAPARPSR